MTNEDKYKYWEMLSDYDIGTALDLIRAKRWMYVAFLCEQSIERLLKGMYVFYFGREAPKSHNIGFLMTRIFKSELFLSRVEPKSFEAKLMKYENFFDDIVFYYISDYPFSYQKIMDRFVSEKKAMEIYKGTLEVLSWLRAFQKISAGRNTCRSDAF